MESPSGELVVAVDMTPMVAARTGIGHFVAELVEALQALDGGPTLVPYVLSRRAGLHDDRLPERTRRLPLPAGIASRLWQAFGRPALDGGLEPADVIHGTNFIAPPSRRRAVVVTVHDLAFARFPDLCSAAARRAGGVARRLASRGAWIHTPSEFVAQEAREILSTDRVRAIPHGVPRLPPPASESSQARALVTAGPFVLALGTLEPRKRHAELVTAFGHVVAAHPDLRLVLAGSDGPARPAVDAAVQALPVQWRPRVVITGHVDDPTRAALLRHAEVFVYPSLYEGFGLPVLEAMTVGTPVVAARSGGVAECADGAAVLVDGHPDEMAGALNQILEDTALRDHLVEAGGRRASEFSWDRTARQMAALYRRAVTP